MLFSIVGLSLIAVSICLILKKTNPEFSMLVSLVAGILIFAIIIGNIYPIFDVINKWTSDFNLNNIYISTVMKSLGICYLTQLASETCKDSGYSAIAIKIELTGKITIILMALPMFLDLMQIIQRMVYLN